MALAMEWVSRITTVALEMVLPGVLGGWLDGRLGTGYLGLIGFAFGFAVGFWHLLRMTKSPARESSKGDPGAQERVLENNRDLDSDTPP